MRNNKGFTLTEVLLAVMIVGIVGVALAALTSTATRESNLGRTRMMLRHQISMALRQLRQDVHLSTEIETCSSSGWTLKQDADKKIGPDYTPATVTYSVTCSGNICTIKRNGEDWLNNVKSVSVDDFSSPSCELAYQTPDGNMKTAMRLTLVVGVDSEPPVTETVEEVFMVPHGY